MHTHVRTYVRMCIHTYILVFLNSCFLQWLSDNGIVQMLIDLIQVGVDEDLCMNVAQLLGDVVRVGRESYQMAIPSPIVVKLEEQDSIERLLTNMLDTEEKSDVVIVSGISFLLSLIEPRRCVV